MTAAPQPDQVRQLVVQIFAEFGVAVRSFLELHETLLLEDRRFVARSYRSRGLMAMWLLNAGIIQFYDAEGTMLRTVNLFKELRPHTAAA
jgi:hypothetical protein